YKDAKEREAIITSLLPATVSDEERETAARATNAKVLEAFRAHLYGSKLGPKVVERDLDNVTSFAEDFLLAQPDRLSLRDFGSHDVKDYLAHIRATMTPKELQRRKIELSLKRFIRFLLDTDRMDIDE